MNLSAYTAVAAVDSTTNGLKEVTKNGSTFSFGARQTGSGSGIKGETLKNADEAITAAPKEYSGNFGEMLRVDLNNNYGDLGSHMQTVVWKYYGDGDTVLATYGTKFAADDWMHKSMGIQLGLTDSLRFKLPEGKDGTGKWTLTVYALGYSDTTYEVTVTADNLPKAVEPMTNEQRTQLTNLAKQAKDLLPNYPDTSTANEAELKKHYDQAAALLENEDATSAAAAELIDELPGLIQAVKDERATKPTTTVQYGQYTISEDDLEDPYTVKLKVTLNSDGTIKLVEDNGTEPGESNTSFWNNAKNGYTNTKKNETYIGLFTSLIGKSATEIDSVDAVSKATVSSNAIKKAVKNALSK